MFTGGLPHATQVLDVSDRGARGGGEDSKLTRDTRIVVGMAIDAAGKGWKSIETLWIVKEVRSGLLLFRSAVGAVMSGVRSGGLR